MPVEGVNPLAGFYAAITRLTEEGTSPHGPDGWCVSSVRRPEIPTLHEPWKTGVLTSTFLRFPEQRMSRMEALKGRMRTFIDEYCFASKH